MLLFRISLDGCLQILCLPTLNLKESIKYFRENFYKSCYLFILKFHTAIMVYKTLNHLAPLYMSEIFTFSHNEVHNLRSIDHKALVLKTVPHTYYFKDSFSYFSIDISNKLPFSIKQCLTLQSFKNSCNFVLNLQLDA
jgi:hypothetical protein